MAERFLEIKVVVGVIGVRRSLELNQEVEVAHAWPVCSSGGGAEEIKPTDPIPPAQAGHFCVAKSDVWGHGLIPGTGYPGALLTHIL